MRTKKSDSIITSIIQLLSVLVIPLTVPFIANSIQKGIAESSTNKGYVDIAIQILSQDPAKNKDLRPWAVELLNKTSPVPLPEETQKNLQKVALLQLIATARPNSNLAFSDGSSDDLRSQLATLNSAKRAIEAKEKLSTLDLQVVEKIEMIRNTILNERFGRTLSLLFEKYRANPHSVTEAEKQSLKEIEEWTSMQIEVP